METSKNIITRQRGFTLVELMVALVIGLIIILGAGKIFLAGWQNFHNIQELSDRQAVLNFAVDSLVRDIRRASPDNICPIGNRLNLEVDGESVLYALDDGESESASRDGRSLMLNGEPLLNGLVNADNAFSVTPDSNDGLCVITLRFRSVRGSDGNSDVFEFHVMNRTKAVNSD